MTAVKIIPPIGAIVVLGMVLLNPMWHSEKQMFLEQPLCPLLLTICQARGSFTKESEIQHFKKESEIYLRV